MNGSISVVQLIFGGLVTVAIIAVAGLCCSLLCVHALGGVKARMVTSEKLDVFKVEFERFFEHKLNTGLGNQSRAIDELRDEVNANCQNVASIQSSNSALVKQMELMSHNLMRVHEEHVNRLLEQLAEAHQRNSQATTT